MKVTLVRHAYLRHATLGRLYAGSLRLCTLEEPWLPDPDGPGGQRRENALPESCVPDGIYDLVPHSGGRFKNVWALVNPALGVYRWPQDIPADQQYGRSAILIHSGNTVDNTIGCILVGLAFMGADRVTNSLAALAALRDVLGIGSDHQLEIRPIAGTKE